MIEKCVQADHGCDDHPEQPKQAEGNPYTGPVGDSEADTYDCTATRRRDTNPPCEFAGEEWFTLPAVALRKGGYAQENHSEDYRCQAQTAYRDFQARPHPMTFS